MFTPKKIFLSSVCVFLSDYNNNVFIFIHKHNRYILYRTLSK